MAIPTTTRQWLLREKPTQLPELDGDHATFELTTTNLPSLASSQILVQTIYLSNDPAQRGWISADADPERLYVPPQPVGEPMGSFAVAKVLESTSDDFQPGNLVLGKTDWAEYAVLDAKDCHPAEPLPGLRPSHYMGSFGLPGLTAYYGLVEIVKTTKEDTVVVSGAAGATGSMAVQIAKRIIGCKRVIGIAGTEEKCRWVESLGADLCLNYKSPSFEKDLWAATEGFVEVFYDNVGGHILDLMLLRLKRNGRIAACGTISSYNGDSDATALKNFYEIISNRLRVFGFIVLDYLEKAPEVQGILVDAWQQGKIVVDDSTETVIEGRFEDIPRIWLKLFDGSNTGKLTTQLIE